MSDAEHSAGRRLTAADGGRQLPVTTDRITRRPAPARIDRGAEGRGPDRDGVWIIPDPPPEPRPPRRALPAGLFVLTCLSTFLVGGPGYAATLMFILLAHELGHYLQARKNGVPASLPYFIPMPFTPIGTMGAIIAMRPRVADTRALFDLAITGPIAGLVPSLVASYVGLLYSEVRVAEESEAFIQLGEPLVFQWMSWAVFGNLEEGYTVMLGPVAYAGWVGLFITALNLLPIGQLDGGHILYTLLPSRAYHVSLALLAAAALGVVIGGYWQWSLMLMILVLIGVRHPPTAGGEPLDLKRKILGWMMLAFVVVGFTPTPFIL